MASGKFWPGELAYRLFTTPCGAAQLRAVCFSFPLHAVPEFALASQVLRFRLRVQGFAHPFHDVSELHQLSAFPQLLDLRLLLPPRRRIRLFPLLAMPTGNQFADIEDGGEIWRFVAPCPECPFDGLGRLRPEATQKLLRQLRIRFTL